MIVYTANLQGGAGTDGSQNFSRQVAVLAEADLIGVQERTDGSTGWDAALSSAGLAQAVYRINDVSQNDGSAIWYKSSTVTIIDIYETDLSEGASTAWSGNVNVDKSAVAVKASVSGQTFYFVTTHLAWSLGADSNGSTFSAIRVAQIQTLLSWISSTLTGGYDTIIVGDMNFGPDYPKNPSGLQLDLFTANYTDLWQQGMSEGKASAEWGDRDVNGSPDMPLGSLTTRTHDTRRIDYCFLNLNPRTFALTAIDVPDLRANCSGALTGSPTYCADTDAAQRWSVPDDFGVRPSDHNWIRLRLDWRTGARVKSRVRTRIV